MKALLEFLDAGPVVLEVLAALGPLVVFFVLFQAIFLRLPARILGRMAGGMAQAFVGLVFFLQGVKVGFLPVGRDMGIALGSFGRPWVLVPIGFLLGFAATAAEPAVRILGEEVERASAGSIRSRVIIPTLSVGVAVFVALGMFRILTGIPLVWFLVPGYAAALAMLPFSGQTFVSIAFDSGGVATGPMTVTFVMALAVGAAGALENRHPVLDGFGLIALVALAPILSVLVLGLVYSGKKGKKS
ncbi:MAG: DUF1538 domain-containing protein [Candidatus Aminicenantes bacterium]|nr:DUF1538 domain-containing protein [Candidatus Aminicenantes bacterium]